MGNTCVALGVYTDSWLLTSVLGGWLLSSAAAGGLGWKIPLSLPVWVDSKDMFEFFFFFCVIHISEQQDKLRPQSHLQFFVFFFSSNHNPNIPLTTFLHLAALAQTVQLQASNVLQIKGP